MKTFDNFSRYECNLAFEKFISLQQQKKMKELKGEDFKAKTPENFISLKIARFEFLNSYRLSNASLLKVSKTKPFSIFRRKRSERRLN